MSSSEQALVLPGASFPATIQQRVGSVLATLAPGMAQGATTVLLGHPLDTAKTRMQAASPMAQSSVLRTMVHIARYEGAADLYRGAGPYIAMEGAKRGLQFALWDVFRRYSSNTPALPPSIFSMEWVQAVWHRTLGVIGSSSFLSGAVAGGLGTCLGCPMHVIKIQTQYQTAGQTLNAWTCLKDIWKREGCRGFYRGFRAHVLKDICFAGSYLGMYANCKRVAERQISGSAAVKRQLGSSCQTLEAFLSGSAASMLTWLLLYPLDTMKTVIQSRKMSSISSFYHHHQYLASGSVYRGLSASLFRAGPVAGVAMVAYESVKQSVA